MKQPQYMKEVQKFVNENSGMKIKIFNGEWCVYEELAEPPFNFTPVDQFYEDVVKYN